MWIKDIIKKINNFIKSKITQLVHIFCSDEKKKLKKSDYLSILDA